MTPAIDDINARNAQPECVKCEAGSNKYVPVIRKIWYRFQGKSHGQARRNAAGMQAQLVEARFENEVEVRISHCSLRSKT